MFDCIQSWSILQKLSKAIKTWRPEACFRPFVMFAVLHICANLWCQNTQANEYNVWWFIRNLNSPRSNKEIHILTHTRVVSCVCAVCVGRKKFKKSGTFYRFNFIQLRNMHAFFKLNFVTSILHEILARRKIIMF